MPVSDAGLAALAGFAALLLFWMAGSDYLRIVDDINLVIHESGHPIIGILGYWPMVWGGTLMELIVPAAIAVVFWYQRSALSAAFAGIWFFENFHYIARYIADARAEELPLVGGGEHDWNNLLSHYGVLEKDLQIAHVVNLIGYLGIVASLAFAVGVWLNQRAYREAAPPVQAPPKLIP
jgi:hypothetical protein